MKAPERMADPPTDEDSKLLVHVARSTGNHLAPSERLRKDPGQAHENRRCFPAGMLMQLLLLDDCVFS